MTRRLLVGLAAVVVLLAVYADPVPTIAALVVGLVTVKVARGGRANP